jgi:hypothetical protein
MVHKVYFLTSGALFIHLAEHSRWQLGWIATLTGQALQIWSMYWCNMNDRVLIWPGENAWVVGNQAFAHPEVETPLDSRTSIEVRSWCWN